MILVCGPDELLVREVVRDLNQRGQLAKALQSDAHVFSEVVALRATAVVGVLPRHPRAAEDDACEFVKSLTEAATAPPAPRIVLVTPAPPHALHLHALRRSGAPYVVISSAALKELPAAVYLPKRPVWVAAALLDGEHAIVTRETLLHAIADAVDEDAAVGVESAPEQVSWAHALRSAGVRVRMVPAWLARLARLLGQPAMYRNPADNELVMRLGYEDTARALGALSCGDGA